ncbi:MAG: nucleotidyltransferase family protein [Candidatus Thermoplasmatota archaeon]|nr:nucleotidyltransferase family protein [Candidatus Thermoplasmatota archaeon]
MSHLDEIREKIVEMLRGFGVKRIALFGSFVRGDLSEGSDVDILVEFSERKSLLDIVRIERELSEFIGIKADLLTEKSISPYMLDRIRSEMQVVYSAEG